MATAMMVMPLASCSKWLDIIPEDTTVEKNLFSDAAGYYSAVNGIYQTLATDNLYGKNLSWGFASALSQDYDNYSINNSKAFSRTENYEYGSDEVKAYGEQIWQNGYNVVANANNVLKHIETVDEDFFPNIKFDDASLIKGEMLAVRALVQFDLLRLFAPSPKENASAKAIPYVKEYPSFFNERLTVGDVLANVEKDLIDAKDLLAEADTLKGLYEFESVSNLFQSTNTAGLFFSARGSRLNYFAVTALLARVYAYAGDLDNAYKYATEFKSWCSNDKCGYKYTEGWTDSDTPESRPHKLIDEIVIGFYRETLAVDYESVTSGTDGSTNSFALKGLGEIFSDSDDVRRLKLVYDNSLDVHVSLKYKTRKETGSRTIVVENRLVPVLRLPEINLIIAEYLVQNGRSDEAAELVNELRSARRCASNKVDASTVADAIGKEFRRESIAEGQYFFFCKRTGAAQINAGGVYIDMAGKYTMNIPDSEITLN